MQSCFVRAVPFEPDSLHAFHRCENTLHSMRIGTSSTRHHQQLHLTPYTSKTASAFVAHLRTPSFMHFIPYETQSFSSTVYERSASLSTALTTHRKRTDQTIKYLVAAFLYCPSPIVDEDNALLGTVFTTHRKSTDHTANYLVTTFFLPDRSCQPRPNMHFPAVVLPFKNSSAFIPVLPSFSSITTLKFNCRLDSHVLLQKTHFNNNKNTVSRSRTDKVDKPLSCCLA